MCDPAAPAKLAETQPFDAAMPAEQLLPALLSCATDAIIGTTVDDIITIWNAGAAQLYGYTADEAIGQRLSLIIPTDRPDELPELMAQLRQGYCLQHLETEHVRKDGGRLTISLSVAPVRDEADRIVGGISIGHELAEQQRPIHERHALRLRAEQEEVTRTASDARLQAIWEATSEALALSDSEGIVLDVNPAYCALYGRPASEFIGQSFALIFPEEARTAAEAQYREIFTSSQAPATYETSFAHPDGTEHMVEARADFLVHAGQRVAMLSTVRDITERKQLEQAQLDFVGMVSHDLTSPLTVLRARAQLLQRRQIYDETSVAAILEQTVRMGRLIDDLRDLVQVEGGGLALQLEALDLGELARGAVLRARTLGVSHPIHGVYPDRPTIIQGDRDRLGQVLDNLIGNAVKYSPAEREIVVRVEPAAGKAQVSVVDQGMGIPPQELPHIFGRFVRGKRDASQPGLGLGLYITRMLVEAHSGQIWATSQLGKGSTFTVALPAGP